VLGSLEVDLDVRRLALRSVRLGINAELVLSMGEGLHLDMDTGVAVLSALLHGRDACARSVGHGGRRLGVGGHAEVLEATNGPAGNDLCGWVSKAIVELCKANVPCSRLRRGH